VADRDADRPVDRVLDEGLVDDALEHRLEAELEEFLEPHGRAARVGERGWRARLRRTRGGAVALKAGVFLLGLVFIGIGLAAVVLPGPLTIPPMLLGLWIWASEFEWADSLFQRAKRSGLEAWEQAKRRPVLSAVTTVGGLVAVGVLVWAVSHYGWVDTAKGWVGL
jgi:uncharacterized membrane protein YbaN (DUF454 family)